MKELFRYFLKLGTFGFGGPIAMIGMMEDQFVRREKSLTNEEFQRFVAAAKLFPGAVATLIAIRIGVAKQGRLGGLIAGLCQVLPAFFMILILGHFMIDAKSASQGVIAQLFHGLNFGGLALCVVAAYRFSKPLVSSHTFFYFGATAILTYFHPQEEIFFLLACGILALLFHQFKGRILEASSVMLSALFLESFKASLFTYGTGMAMVPVMKAVYVDKYHWLSESDFLTGLSFGQMTPGPLIIFNSYLANQLAGPMGATFALVGIFLPTFLFGLWVMPAFEKRMLNTPILKVFFSGMLPAVGGAIAGSVTRLCILALASGTAPDTSFSAKNIILLGGLVVFIFKTKLHPVFVIAIGAVSGVLLSYAG